MKLNSAISNFLTNKFVLHVVSFLALFNVIGYMMIGNYNIVLYFIIFSFLIRYFSKNMIVVLGIPLILVNMLALNNNSYFEGFEGDSEDTKDEKDKKDEKDTKDTKDTKDSKKDEKDKKNKKDAAGEPIIGASNEKSDESFEIGRKGHKIDYATTIEEAYDNLNSILGKDGIKNLTEDTQRLMKQQSQLAGSLKDMGPLMEKMSPMMDQVTQMMESMPKEGKDDIMNKVQDMLGALKKN
jgi:hypothetical protein